MKSFYNKFSGNRLLTLLITSFFFLQSGPLVFSQNNTFILDQPDASTTSGTQYYCNGVTIATSPLIAGFTVTSCYNNSGFGNADVTATWYVNTTKSTTGGSLVGHTERKQSVSSGPITFTLPANLIALSSFQIPSNQPLTQTISRFYYCVISYSTNNKLACGSNKGTPTSNFIQVTVTRSVISQGWKTNPSTICAGQAYTFEANPMGAATSYAWSITNSAGVTITDLSSTKKIYAFASNLTQPDTRSISITGSGCGTSATLTQPVIFTTPSIQSITPFTADYTICQNLVNASSLSVSASFYNNNPGSYQWYSNTSASTTNGISLGASAQSATYTPQANTSGTLYYYCVVKGAVADGGCPNTSSISGAWTVKASPPAPTLSSSILQDSIVTSGDVKVNVSGLLPNRPHSVTYTIGGTAGIPSTFNSDLSGNGSFVANTSAGLTPENANNASLANPSLTITTGGTPDCPNTGTFSANLQLMVSATTRTQRADLRTSSNWSSANAWISGVPSPLTGTCDSQVNADAGTCYGVGTSVPVYIGHNLVVDQDVTITDGVFYFGARGRNQPSSSSIADDVDPLRRNLTINGSGGNRVANQAIVDIQSGTTRFDGQLNISEGALYVRNGATLIIGSVGVYTNSMTIGNSSYVYVEEGGTLIVKGNVLNTNAGNTNSNNTVDIRGYFFVDGNYVTDNGNVNIIGSGDFVTTGSMTTQGGGTIFGSGNDCTSGPCSGTALACGTGGNAYTASVSVNGVTATSVSVCSGDNINLSFTTNAPPAYTYTWEVSLISPTSGYTTLVTGSPTATDVGASGGTKYYRMNYTTSTCVVNSAVVPLYSNPVTVNIVPKPVFVSQPQPTSACFNSTGSSISVEMSVPVGTSIQSYSWYQTTNSTTPVSVVTNSSTLDSYAPPTSAIGSSSYYVNVLTSAGCKVSSATALFTVLGPPQISSLSAPAQTQCQNSALNALSVTATGATSYQWYSNPTASNASGTSLGAANGAQTASFTPSSTAAGTTFYYVVATGCGTATSTVSGPITVKPAAKVTGQPASIAPSTCYGGAFIDPATQLTAGPLTITAAGTNLQYQWYSNSIASNTGGTSLGSANGAKTATYTPSSTVPGITYYYVVVTDIDPATNLVACGTDVSAVSGAWDVKVATTWNPVGTSKAWDNESNWQGCGVPNANLDATIPGGTEAIVNIAAATRSLSVNGTLNFDANASLSIFGNLDVQGSFNSYANKNTIQFSGSNQTITSRAVGIDGIAPIQVQDMVIANSGGVVSNDAVRLDLFGVLTLNGNSNFDADGSSNTGVIRLRSTDEFTAASIAELPTTATLSGLVTYQRNIGNPIFPDATNNGFRYVATPVTGFTVGAQLFPWLLYKNLYAYNEKLAGGINTGWVALNTASPIDAGARGRGYFSYRTPGSWISRGTVTVGNNALQPGIKLPLTYTNTGNMAADGWNLAGNPYPAPIQWNSTDWLLNSSIDPVIFIPDIKNNVWNSWSTSGVGNDPAVFSGIIASGQAFWIHATGASPVAIVYESAKRPYATAKFFRQATNNRPTLEISLIDEGIVDKSIILLDAGATRDFDPGRDADKLEIQDWGVSTVSGEHRLIHNYVESVEGAPIYLEIKGAPGTYSLQFNDRFGSGDFERLYLIDHFLGTSQPIKMGVPVLFQVTEDAASRSGRFAISSGKAVDAGEELFTSWPNPAAGGLVQLRAVSREDVEFQVLALDGRPLQRGILKAVDGLASGVADMSSAARGMYLIQARVNGKSLVIKQIVR